MSSPCTVEEMIDKFDVQRCAENTFICQALSGGRGAVDASQILAQAIVAVGKTEPDKFVKSVQMVFSKVASDKSDIELAVEPMHSGRSFSSLTVTAWQQGQLRARGLVLMDSNEPDLIRHQATMPEVASPEESYPLDMPVVGREVRLVEQLDLMDPEDVGPAKLNVWVKYDCAPDQASMNCALIGHMSNHFSIATAMRPHKGISQSMAHRSLSCGILALTVSFYEPLAKADQWLLYSHESLSAGRGLSHGQATVFSQEGLLVASFTQESMIRSVPKTMNPALDESDQRL